MTESTPQFVEIFASNADQPAIAKRLLGAAGDAPEQVATVFQGFRVPSAIAEAAGFSVAEDGAVDAMAVEGQALTNTAVAQRPAPATGLAATSGAQTGGTLATAGNEPAAGGTHEEATTGAPTEADVPQGDPNDGATAGSPPPADGERPEVQTGDAAPSDPADAVGDPTGEPEPLRGEALEQALRDRDLSLAGTADEKRARVAAYDAAQK